MKFIRLSPHALRVVAPNLSKREAAALSVDLAHAMRTHGINTKSRAATFIAQVAHESGGFKWREELASGREYEGRADLGNIHPGDGVRYKGRGYLQITGRANYRAVSKALHMDFITHPEKLKWPTHAASSAAWWWQAHGLNQKADAGSRNFIAITRIINGGTNGLASRLAYYARARALARFLIPKVR